jgi:hypothetical protein
MRKMVFKKGEVTNPKGRPIGAKGKLNKSMLDKLIEIAGKVEENKTVSQGKSLLEHFVERAYRNDQVLVTYLKKIIADRNYLTESKEGNGSVQIIKFQIVSTLYTQAEEMIKYASESMSKEIELLQNKKISIPEFKDNMIKLMVEKAKEDDEFINNQNQEKEEEKDTGKNEKSSSE